MNHAPVPRGSFFFFSEAMLSAISSPCLGVAVLGLYTVYTCLQVLAFYCQALVRTVDYTAEALFGQSFPLLPHILAGLFPLAAIPDVDHH